MCLKLYQLNKLNLPNLTLDTQNDIRSIPNRVVVAHESKVATVRLEKCEKQTKANKINLTLT